MMQLRGRYPLTIESARGGQRQVVFKLKTEPAAREALRSLGGGPTARRGTRAPLNALLGHKMVASIEPLFPGGQARRASVADRLLLSVEEPDTELAGLNVLTAHSAKAADEACARLAGDSRVEYAHVVVERFLFLPARGRTRRPWRRVRRALDPLQSRQWGLGAIKLFQAQAAAAFREATDVVIAVIDTGVDAGHPDLAGVLVDEQNFTSGPLRDTKGHGTHVIGIIGAVRNNQVGISGVCQSRRIMSLKALGPYNGPGYYRAIRHATDNGAQVISLSLGGGHDPTEDLLIRRALRRGVVVVAAMGNEFQEGNPTSYPAALPGVVAVGASTEVDGHAPFSNTGRHIDLVAPGVNILSTVPTYPSELAETTSYDSWPGTSMATPFVSAAAALVLAKRPGATRTQVRRALVGGADRVPGQRGFNAEFGWGRLNVAAALARI